MFCSFFITVFKGFTMYYCYVLVKSRLFIKIDILGEKHKWVFHLINTFDTYHCSWVFYTVAVSFLRNDQKISHFLPTKIKQKSHIAVTAKTLFKSLVLTYN